MTAIQPSQLLPSLFESADASQCLTVLNIGSALPETVEFFADYRCKLFFVDIFSELPMTVEDEYSPSLQAQFSALMDFGADIQFDVCLFWDVFNFLDSEAIATFLGALRPYLHTGSRAHAFAVHSLKSAPSSYSYGIQSVSAVTTRDRAVLPPGYSPHPQSRLRELLDCFKVDRSVLLAASRLELLLKASL